MITYDQLVESAERALAFEDSLARGDRLDVPAGEYLGSLGSTVGSGVRRAAVLRIPSGRCDLAALPARYRSMSGRAGVVGGVGCRDGSPAMTAKHGYEALGVQRLIELLEAKHAWSGLKSGPTPMTHSGSCRVVLPERGVQRFARARRRITSPHRT